MIGRGHVAQPCAEGLRVALLRRRGRRDEADCGIELARCRVVQHRVGLGELVALPLLRDDVQELRTAEFLQVLQRGDQRLEVVAVDRPDVVEAELLEHRGRDHHALRVLLELLRELEQRRRDAEHLAADVLRGRVELAAHQPRQVLVERADRRRDRHVVVVEDHEQVGVGHHAGVVQRLVGHAGRHRAVADHRDALAVPLALELRGGGHAERGRDAGRRMRGAEGVVLGLVTLRKARDAVLLAATYACGRGGRWRILCG